MNDTTPTQIGIFAKYWTPGKVKTRLAADIGDERAAAVARLFVETLIRRLNGGADRHVIGFAPAEASAAFSTLAPSGWQVEPQCEGDLGARMRYYFETAFAAGAGRVILLGADSPNVPLAVIREAFERLADQRLVLGPTDDGGYYLIGARSEAPPVFDAMPWSDATLWQATTDRLAARGWRQDRDWSPLPPWYDVDTMDDMQRLRTELQETSDDQALAALRDSLEEVLA
ncbi:MAG: TIGR04282 family arsenosugar biosynthesis glycosyltransferase [Planctomycetota bacterium]